MQVTNTIIDLSTCKLPLFDSSESSKLNEDWISARGILETSDGYIFVSPEWDGMFSVGLHNLFHYVEHEMADKPVLLVGVSANKGGRYPLLQMRSAGYKNRHFVIIPESLFYDHVKEALVDGNLTDERMEQRTDYALRTLVEYTKALKSVRSSGVVDYQTFKNGM